MTANLQPDLANDSAAVSGCERCLVLHLVLTYHWYDETESGRKRIEYRKMSDRWRRLIWDRRHEITHVRFARGYTSTMQTFEVEKIDVGSCPIEGWNDEYFRIHFKQNVKADARPKPKDSTT